MAANQLHRPDQADLHQVPGRQQVSCLHHHRDHHHHHHRRHQAIVHHHQPHQHDHQLRDPMHCKKGDSFITKPAAKNNTVEQPRMSVSDDKVIVILRMMMVMTITMMLVMMITMMMVMTITIEMVTMKQIKIHHHSWCKREGPSENFPSLSPYGNLKVKIP